MMIGEDQEKTDNIIDSIMLVSTGSLRGREGIGITQDIRTLALTPHHLPHLLRTQARTRDRTVTKGGMCEETKERIAEGEVIPDIGIRVDIKMIVVPEVPERNNIKAKETMTTMINIVGIIKDNTKYIEGETSTGQVLVKSNQKILPAQARFTIIKIMYQE